MSDRNPPRESDAVGSEDVAGIIRELGLDPEVLREQHVDLDALFTRLQDEQYPVDPNVVQDAMNRGLDLREFMFRQASESNQDFENALQDFIAATLVPARRPFIAGAEHPLALLRLSEDDTGAAELRAGASDENGYPQLPVLLLGDRVQLGQRVLQTVQYPDGRKEAAVVG